MQGAVKDRNWAVSALNSTYLLCPTYPSLLMLPAEVYDDTIVHAAKFRSKHRLPALSWRHPHNGASITR